MAECTAGMRLHDFADGSTAFLSCDLDSGEEHKGLNHHDPVYGIWWGRCDLDEHGHADPDSEGLRVKRLSDLPEAARIRDDLRSGAARQQRTAAGVSAADIARVLDVTPQAVSYWETGQKVPSVRHALAYGKAVAKAQSGAGAR